MKQDIVLEANVRGKEKADHIRKEGKIPAVVYGKKISSTPVSVDAKVCAKLLSHVGETTLVTLDLGKDGKHVVLIRDVERHPLSGSIMHVDFLAVTMDEKVEAFVELVVSGEAPVVKEQGGTLIIGLDEVGVRALPKDLPSSLPVDVSVLTDFDHAIHVKDLPVSEGVEILADPETIIASIARPRTEEEDMNGAQPDVSQVEVEEKGKKEEATEEDK